MMGYFMYILRRRVVLRQQPGTFAWVASMDLLP